jgi:isopentenyl phosphate kinase
LPDLVFVKLGGSLITDKTVPMTPRQDVIDRCAAEISAAADAGLSVLVGHGSGSFGHTVASEYGTRQGVQGESAWRGFAQVAVVAAELNHLVVRALVRSGLAAVALPPSASALCRGGELAWMDVRVARSLLAAGAVPVVFGDVAIDERLGGTIVSTEQVFAYLAIRLKPARIVLAGEVDGVYNCDPVTAPSEARIYSAIGPENYHEVISSAGGARGVDVTGGMLDKVRRMYDLAARLGRTQAQIVNGNRPDLLRRAMLGQATGEGTLLVV